MTELDSWLKQATRHLSKDSADQVRTEIREHYESARETGFSGGLTADEADRSALTALGDAKTANRQYRKVLLTSAEAKMLRDANWEAKAVCSRGWLKRTILAMPIAALVGSAAFFLGGAITIARVLLVAWVGMGLLAVAIKLPVYTPSRGRVFRVLKWGVLVAMFVLAFGPDARKFFWLMLPCFWPMMWIEWTRASIRKKLPVAKWPKPLYL